MKNCWTILILAALLQCFVVVVLGGGHHGHGSNLAHILAAGLIVQLLGSRQQHGHHHHQGRHSGAEIHSEHSPYAHRQQAWGAERNPMSPEATFSSSTWAQRAPMDIAYSHAQYKEPVMDSYNVPYFYRPPGVWGM